MSMSDREEELLEEEAVFVVGGVEFDPARSGYTAVHNYAHYFWRPYLGNTAFALWELLLSFCYGDKDTAYPSIARLARMLTNSDASRAVVTGRRRACGKTSGVAQTRQVSGALGVLRRERLVQVTRQGTGVTSSYAFRVRQTLPVLRPDQVARLCSALQRDHTVWLARHGIDQHAYSSAFARPDPGCALGTTPCAQGNSPHAPDTGPCAPGSTNNPQEESLWNHWWQDTLSELQPQLMRDTFEICLQRSLVQSFHDGVLTLRAASPLARDVLQHRLAPLLQRTLHRNSGGQVERIQIAD